MQVNIEKLDNERLPLSKRIIRAAILYLLKFLKLKKGQLNIYFIDKRRIRLLNRRYLKKDKPTDVLSFNLNEKKGNILAEIFICLALAKRNAVLYKNSFAHEVMLYIIHAILHILGFDDRSKKERRLMLNKQESLLSLVSSYIYSRYKIRIN
ncbi:MAG: rRNA maturation RNase YbeY [Candidatus Omnitrophica bacterium]|nr:rRNA maturation RNase YbeY [Candidatus Omnitrophota bacterium]